MKTIKDRMGEIWGSDEFSTDYVDGYYKAVADIEELINSRISDIQKIIDAVPSKYRGFCDEWIRDEEGKMEELKDLLVSPDKREREAK